MRSSTSVFVDANLELAATWEKEAEGRRARTPNVTDPVADAIASCASELRARTADVEKATALLTVAQYARHRGVDQSTVRRWCALGQLEGAEQAAGGDWRIPREARKSVAKRVAVRA